MRAFFFNGLLNFDPSTNFHVVTCEDIFIQAKSDATRSNGVAKQDNNFCHHNCFNHTTIEVSYQIDPEAQKLFYKQITTGGSVQRNQQIVIVFRRSCRGAEALFKGQSPGGFCGFATVSK